MARVMCVLLHEGQHHQRPATKAYYRKSMSSSLSRFHIFASIMKLYRNLQCPSHARSNVHAATLSVRTHGSKEICFNAGVLPGSEAGVPRYIVELIKVFKLCGALCKRSIVCAAAMENSKQIEMSGTKTDVNYR